MVPLVLDVPRPTGIWLEDLYVDPEARGAGVGSALLAHLRTLTDGRIEWSVLDWNQKAIDFYESIGARPRRSGLDDVPLAANSMTVKDRATKAKDPAPRSCCSGTSVGRSSTS